MNKYSVCIVSKEYRYIEVEAGNNAEALDTAWNQIENALNKKPEDYDTEIYLEGEVK